MDATVFETEGAMRLAIRAEALINEAFLRVIRTGEHGQVVVMALPADADTGDAVCADGDRLFVVVEGVGEARVGDDALGVEAGDLVFVEAGTPHNIVNRAVSPLRLIAVCSPPAYPRGTVVATRPAIAPKPRAQWWPVS